MLDLLTLKQRAFGIDLSDVSLKIVQLEPARKGLRLASFAEVSLEKGVIDNGKIIKEEEAVTAVRRALQQVHGKKLKTKYVVASLPEQKAFAQVVQLPKMGKKEAAQAVRFQAENYIPYSIETVYLDYSIIPPIQSNIDHMDVLLASLPKEVVDPYVNVLIKAGLKPVALEIESLALSRVLIEKSVSPIPVLIIDLGASSTNVSIFSGHSLRLTASMTVSADGFTLAIANALRVEQEKAQELMHAHGLADEDHPAGKQVKESIFPALQDFAAQIAKYMEYHESHMPHQHLKQRQKKIKKIILCGGGANLKGLPDFLTKTLKTEVIVGNPWVNILSPESKEIPALSFQDSLRYTTALGLALRGVNQLYD